MADGRTKPLSGVRPGDLIYGTVRRGWYRRYIKTEVTAHWATVKPAFEITLADGTSLIAGPDHRFLTDRGWKFVAAGRTQRPHLTTNNKLMGTGAYALSPQLGAVHEVGPAITRKCHLEGSAVKTSVNLRVRSVRPLGRRLRLYDLTTGTGDFFANGVLSHNCYARPYHEYLGFSAGLDFESKILVKESAPELLRRELMSPKWQPRVLGISGVTDAYQPIERRLQLTRRCLEVLAEARNPVAIITKNHLVTRDCDLIAELARHNAAAVFLSITTLDPDLGRRMEPRASAPAGRLAAITELRRAGIPAGVMVAPIIPGLTDHEIPAILEAAADAGAAFACRSMLRLPYGVAELFETWLTQHFPDRKDKVLGRIRDIRGGALNDSQFGRRMRGEGVLAKSIADLFEVARAKVGLPAHPPELSAAAFRRPADPSQPTLFDGLGD